MDTLEARNLNRLRNGKMMLEFSKQKKSYGLALLLTIIAGALGAHRFYLGHKPIGFAFLILLGLNVLLIVLGNGTGNDQAILLSGLTTVLLTILIIIEIAISYWVVGRENYRIKSRLAKEYGVQELKV